jgi:hypothetical protein
MVIFKFNAVKIIKKFCKPFSVNIVINGETRLVKTEDGLVINKYLVKTSFAV